MGATGSEGPNASASRIHEVGMSFQRDAGARFSGMEESVRCKVETVCKEKGGEAGPSYRKGRGKIQLPRTFCSKQSHSLSCHSSHSGVMLSSTASLPRSSHKHVSICQVSGLG